LSGLNFSDIEQAGYREIDPYQHHGIAKNAQEVITK